MAQLLKVDLGSADAAHPGFDRYVDIVRNVNIPADKMVVADLTKPWPFADSSVILFRAHDILEHLPNKIFTLNEAWRVLAPGGQMDIFVPTFDGVGSVCDPTHVSYWVRHSFDYHLAGSAEHNRFAVSYGITSKFKVISEKKTEYVKKYASGPETVRHLSIVLGAVKP